MVERMRILINSLNYFPELTGIGKYNGEMAEWLVGQGFEVRVVAAPPYYPAWKVSEGYFAGQYRREYIEGVTVFRCPLWVPRKPTGLTRILHLASFAVSSFPLLIWHGLFWRPHIVFVVEPPLFCAPTALIAAKIGGAQAWLHVQDFEVDAAFDLGILRAKRLRSLVLAAERLLMNCFNRVTTISERMLERLAAKGVAVERRELFPNWVDLDIIRPLERASSLRKEWGIQDTDVVVLYSGNMGEKQGLEVLIDAARTLQDQVNLCFLLCGNGAARPRLELLSKGMTNICFKPLQPAERLNDLLALADIHVLPQRADAADLVLPSKLTNMLASGRPVVATAYPDTQVAELIRDCGILVSPGDFAGLADAITLLTESREQRRLLGVAARAKAEVCWDHEQLLSQAFCINKNQTR